MLPNRFHRKERHVITNQLSVKKRSYKWLHEVLIVKHLHVLFHVIKRRMEVLTDAFSGQKQVQFQSILGFWQRKRRI